LCACSTRRIAPPNRVEQTGKDRLQKGLTVNSNTVVLGTLKINKMGLVRMAEKGSKTILHRGFTESTKNILKTIKLTENTDIRKAMAIH